jgi:hypothetical protein
VIALLCPTKRPEEFWWMVESVRETTNGRVHVFAYVDTDDLEAHRTARPPKTYPPVPWICTGPQIGPTASLNHLAEMSHADIMGVITDDATLISPNWDLWLQETIDSFPGRLGVVSARHYAGEWCNFPFISKEMLDLIGWYAYPGTYHFAYDTVMEIIGESTSIVHATSDQMLINHSNMSCINPEKYRPDAEAFVEWCVTERRQLARKIRAAQEAAASPPKRSPTTSTISPGTAMAPTSDGHSASSSPAMYRSPYQRP